MWGTDVGRGNPISVQGEVGLEMGAPGDVAAQGAGPGLESKLYPRVAQCVPLAERIKELWWEWIEDFFFSPPYKTPSPASPVTRSKAPNSSAAQLCPQTKCHQRCPQGQVCLIPSPTIRTRGWSSQTRNRGSAGNHRETRATKISCFIKPVDGFNPSRTIPREPRAPNRPSSPGQEPPKHK